MSLAARCTACATVFRVVQDQLRVSDGWVRCGRCGEVFNAIANLVDVEGEGEGRTSIDGLSRAADGHERAAVVDDLAAVAADANESSPPAAAVATDPPVARRPFISPAAPVPAVVPVAAATIQQPALPVGAGDAPLAEPIRELQMPSFVRRADKAARWRRPGVRGALAATSVTATLLLAFQAAVEYRSQLAAQWPVLQPALAGGCALLGCRIEAPRWVEALTVDSSGLTRIEGTLLHRLSLVMHNRAAAPVALPSLELTLTDAGGAMLARRVVAPVEAGVRATALQARGELAMQAVVDTGDSPISGYTILIFYP